MVSGRTDLVCNNPVVNLKNYNLSYLPSTIVE